MLVATNQCSLYITLTDPSPYSPRRLSRRLKSKTALKGKYDSNSEGNQRRPACIFDFPQLFGGNAQRIRTENREALLWGQHERCSQKPHGESHPRRNSGQPSHPQKLLNITFSNSKDVTSYFTLEP